MRKWQNWLIFFFVSGIQFFTMETTVNRRNCQYRMTQSPRNHVSDTGHPLMGTISGRPLWLGPNQTISGLILAAGLNYLLKELVNNDGRNNVAKGILVYIFRYFHLWRNVGKISPILCVFPLWFSWEYYFQTKKTSYELYVERLPLDLESE